MNSHRIFWILNLIVMCSSVYSLWAKAPDTPKIVFTSVRDPFGKDVYVMDIDGSNQMNLTPNLANDFHPTWSPTGEQILYVSDHDGIPDLYLMDAKGLNVRRVFREKAHRETPAWSPDGQWIVYSRPGTGTLNIATRDGDAVEVVARIDKGNVAPAWSPDSTEIAFNDIRSGRIRLLHLQSRTIEVLPRPFEDFVMQNAAWSPDGHQLAFSGSNRFGKEVVVGDMPGIYVINRDGTGLVQVADEKRPAARHPIWSPRGDVLLYEQKTEHALFTTQLFKLVVGQKRVEQLTHVGIRNYQADWFDPTYALPVSPQPQFLTTQWAGVKRSSQRNLSRSESTF